jgi:CHAD domain-containing protein
MLTSAEHPVRQCQAILKLQIDCALRDLDGGAELNVHGARKQLKRARATLRLIRPAIGRSTYQEDNAAVRDAARSLSRTRDTEVMADLVLRLAQSADDSPTKHALSSLNTTLGRHPEKSYESPQSLDNVQVELHRVRTRVTLWPMQDDDWDCLSEGLRSTYRKGRRGLDDAQAEPSTEHLHELRKQTKYTWHQLQLLTPLAAGPVGELADQFHRLSDYLGDDHDLAVLSEVVARPGQGLDRKSIHVVDELVDRRRSDLQGKAFALAQRLYDDSPKAFQERFDAYWARWHG